MTCYVIEDEMATGARCIPNAPGLSGGASLTLCGWTDVTYEEQEGEPTCVECLRIVRYCHGIPVPRRPERAGTGTRRPFKLLWSPSLGGGLTAEHWSSYASLAAAQKGRDRHIASLGPMAVIHDGWWVIKGPGIETIVLGSGREKDRPLPSFTRIR